MTVQTVYDLYLRYKKNLGDVSTELFVDWCDEVNRFAYRIIYGTEPAQYLTTQDYSIVSGTDEYPMPNDFETMSVFGGGVYLVQDGINTAQQLFPTGFGSQQLGYYYQGLSLFITPIPQAFSTVVLRYIPTLSAITAFTDTLVIPDEFIYYVRDAIDCKYDMWDEDPNAEGLADQRFARSLDELARNIRNDGNAYSINIQAGAFQ